RGVRPRAAEDRHRPAAAPGLSRDRRTRGPVRWPPRPARAPGHLRRGARRGARRHARAGAGVRRGGAAARPGWGVLRQRRPAPARGPPGRPHDRPLLRLPDRRRVPGGRAGHRRRPGRHGAARARWARAWGHSRMTSMIPVAIVLPMLVVLFVVALYVGQRLRPSALPQSDVEKQRLLEAAKAESESLKRQAVLDAKELEQKARADVDAELKGRQGDLEKRAAELAAREP